MMTTTTTTNGDGSNQERWLLHRDVTEADRAVARSKTTRQRSLVERLRRAHWALRRARRHAVAAVRR